MRTIERLRKRPRSYSLLDIAEITTTRTNEPLIERTVTVTTRSGLTAIVDDPDSTRGLGAAIRALLQIPRPQFNIGMPNYMTIAHSTTSIHLTRCDGIIHKDTE